MLRRSPAGCLCALLLRGTYLLLLTQTVLAGNEQALSCDALTKVPAEQRCGFVKTNCAAESLVPYAEWYYCHVTYNNAVLRFLYVAAVCCLLPLAFCLLGDTAEFYIAPIMAHVSQAVPKMRPRFAGVTFVALGNGAPDLSANVAAITAGEVVLSAGALTGAAMFVQCIVAAELVSLAGPAGIKCGGAMLRDVGVYCLAITSVLIAFAIGWISHAFVGWAITLYLLYAIWVFAGDEWHQRGRPKPRLDRDALKAMLAGVLPTNIGNNGALRQYGFRVPERPHTRQQPAGVSRDDLEESLLPWAVAEEEDTDSYIETLGFGDVQQRQRYTHNGSISSTGYPNTELSVFSGIGQSRMGSIAQQASQIVSDSPVVVRSPDEQVAIDMSTVVQQNATGQQLNSMGNGRSYNRKASRLQPARRLPSYGSKTYIDPKTYRQLVWADLADDEEEEARLERQIAQQLLAGARVQLKQAGKEDGTYQPPLPAGVAWSAASLQVLAVQQQRQQQQELQPASSLPMAAVRTADVLAVESESGLVLSPFGSAGDRTAPSTPFAAVAGEALPPADGGTSQSSQWHERQQDGQARLRGKGHIQPVVSISPAGSVRWQHSDQEQGYPNAPEQQQQLEEPADWQSSWKQLQWQVTLGNSAEWEDAGVVCKLFRQVTFPLLLPVYLGQRLTIPFPSAAGYSREWLTASLLCCPLALVVYLGLLTLPAVLIACSCGIAAAVAAAVLTWWDRSDQMPVQGLGGTAAAVLPGVLAVVGFIMGVAWIDTMATEVVGALTFLAGLANLPAGVLGLTLLAWGNSLGDFFGNRAMAKAGHASTAITASFAAPLFNMLMSLSLGFSRYLHLLGTNSVKVQLTPEVALGCLFLIGYNIAIITVGRLCGQRLPPWFAYFARAWYGLYFALAVASGFWGSRC